MNAGGGAQDGDRIPTTMRTLALLEAVARIGSPVRPVELSTELSLPKPTIHRLLALLEQQGFLQRELDGRSYSPGPRLRRFSTSVLSSLRIRTARLAVLAALAEDIGETCNIAIPDRSAMTYLDRVETTWPLRIQLPIGSQVPFHCTASGKMYLSTLPAAHLHRYLRAGVFDARTPATITDRGALAAELDRVRAAGFAEDAEEFMEGMIAIAMPIEDGQGRMVATVSFHAPTVRLSLRDAHGFAPRLRSAAQELSALVR